MAERLSDIGRTTRSLAAIGVFGALLIGASFGYDDHFPFGPMGMFSRTVEADGPVFSRRLEGTTADGEVVAIEARALGMRPAELDGQASGFKTDPLRLRYVLETYERMNPGGHDLVSLRLIRGTRRLEDRKVVSFEEEVIAEWSRG